MCFKLFLSELDEDRWDNRRSQQQQREAGYHGKHKHGGRESEHSALCWWKTGHSVQSMYLCLPYDRGLGSCVEQNK